MSFDVRSRSESAVFPVDNVHFQQAAQISKALVDEKVDFEAMVNIVSGKWGKYWPWWCWLNEGLKK